MNDKKKAEKPKSKRTFSIITLENVGGEDLIVLQTIRNQASLADMLETIEGDGMLEYIKDKVFVICSGPLGDNIAQLLKQASKNKFKIIKAD